jgi:hypothetical protein
MFKKENILGYRMLGCEIVNQAIEDYYKAYYTLNYCPQASQRKKHQERKELNADLAFFKSEFFALCTDADPLDIIQVVQSKSAKGLVYNKTKGWVHARRNKK